MNGTVPTLSYVRGWRAQWLLIYTLDSPENKSQQTSYTGRVSWVLVRSVRTRSYVTIPIGGLTGLFVFLTTPKTTNPATRPWVSVRPWPTWSGIIRSATWARCFSVSLLHDWFEQAELRVAMQKLCQASDSYNSISHESARLDILSVRMRSSERWKCAFHIAQFHAEPSL